MSASVSYEFRTESGSPRSVPVAHRHGRAFPPDGKQTANVKKREVVCSMQDQRSSGSELDVVNADNCLLLPVHYER